MKLPLMNQSRRKEEKIVNKVILIKIGVAILKIITLGLPNLIYKLEQKIKLLENKEQDN